MRQTQLQARAEQIEHELGELQALLQRDEKDLQDAHRLLQAAEAQSDSHERHSQELTQRRTSLQTQLQTERAAASAAQEQLHQLEVERQGMQTAFVITSYSIHYTKLYDGLYDAALKSDDHYSMTVKLATTNQYIRYFG